MLSLFAEGPQSGKGWGRREVLRAGGTGLFGLSLPRLLAAESAPDTVQPRAKSVIFLLLFGGPSQFETFDMKPEAPAKIRGPFVPIASRTPELLICEHLPQVAQISDRFCVVRSMTHDYNDHSGGVHYLQTGHRWHIPIGGGNAPTLNDWPSMGSVVEYDAQRRLGLARELPSYMVIPNTLGHLQDFAKSLRPGEHAGWLGQQFNPLTTQVDKRTPTDNPYWRDCTDEELTFQIEGMVAEGLVRNRLDQRRTLLEQFDDARRLADDSRRISGYQSFEQRAMGLITSDKTRAALDIRRESAAVRDRYGRHLFGQSSLMARRLVEAGVRFVTVHYDFIDGFGWDSHQNSHDVKKNLLPTFDQAYSALITDLDERGLLDDTLVVALGEMGRTPLGNPDWGRDHWSWLFPALLAGAGIPGGRVFGKSDKDAAYPIDKPVSPEDLAATLFHALGIDHELRVRNPENRPTPVVDGGSPVLGLWG
ncbi:MAG: DUF1501 domain-containing protein [Planctomycetales bacterium]